MLNILVILSSYLLYKRCSPFQLICSCFSSQATTGFNLPFSRWGCGGTEWRRGQPRSSPESGVGLALVTQARMYSLELSVSTRAKKDVRRCPDACGRQRSKESLASAPRWSGLEPLWPSKHFLNTLCLSSPSLCFLAQQLPSLDLMTSLDLFSHLGKEDLGSRIQWMLFPFPKHPLSGHHRYEWAYHCPLLCLTGGYVGYTLYICKPR